MAIFISISLLLLVLTDIYIWRRFIRKRLHIALGIAWWIPTAIALGAAAACLAGFYSGWLIKTFFVILMCFTVPKAVFVLFSLAGLGLGRRWPAASRVLHWAGIAAALVVCGCALYGIVRGPRRLEVREVTVSFPNLPPSFDGYRIVQISDLHVGTYGSDPSFVEKVAERVNALQADAVVFTGDVINISPEELEPHRAALSSFRARDGVWSVLGNHDYGGYARYDTPDGAEKACARVIETERQLGWHLLLNDHAVIERNGEQIVIAGVENDGRPPFPSRGDLTKAKQGVADSIFTVLLSHDPSHWRREVLPTRAADLTLSGHTHAMQFEIFGFSPSAWNYPEWGGLYREGDRMLYVSKGVGGTAPFRFGAWPEIIVLTLKRE